MGEPAGKYLGRYFGNYYLQQLIGEGGFSEVYLGEHRYLHTSAAIKVLNTRLTSEQFDQFRQEAQTIHALQHAGIVRLFDFGVEDDIPFMAMSYAPKGSLRERYPAGTRLPLPAIILLVKEIAAALHYAHQQHVIHRDVKPENVLIGPDDQLILSDFGIAVVMSNTHTLRTQQIVGTVAYMAPEQLRKKPQRASDQYALAVLVYEWLCGELPFDGSPIEVALQHLQEPPPPLQGKVPALPPAVEQVVLKALEKEPGQRFPTIQAFADTLEQAAQPGAEEALTTPAQACPTDVLTVSTPGTTTPAKAPATARRQQPDESPDRGIAVWVSWPERRRRNPLPRSKRVMIAALVTLALLGLGTARLLGVFFAASQHTTAIAAAQTPLLPLGTAPGDWVEPGFDAQNTDNNFAEHTLNVSNVSLMQPAWLGFADSGPPVLYNVAFVIGQGVMYFTNGPSVIAIDAKTGKTPATFSLAPYTSYSTPALVGDQLFVSSGPGNVLAVNLRTGAVDEIGSFEPPLEGWTYPAPVAANGIIYDVSQGQAAYAIDIQTHRILWQTPLVDVSSSPAVGDGVVYVSGIQHLYALDARTGSLLWQTRDEQKAAEGNQYTEFSAPVVGPRFIYTTVGQYLLAYPRDCSNLCDPAWSFQSVSLFRSSPAFADGRVFASTDGDQAQDDILYALDGNTGKALWDAFEFGPTGLPPIIANGVLYLTDGDADLSAYDASGCGLARCHALWLYTMLDNGEHWSAISRLVAGRYYTLTSNGEIIAFGLP